MWIGFSKFKKTLRSKGNMGCLTISIIVELFEKIFNGFIIKFVEKSLCLVILMQILCHAYHKHFIC